LMLVAAGVLAVSLLLTNAVDTREKESKVQVQSAVKEIKEEPIGKEGAFKLVFQTKYLLMIALLIMILNWVNTTGEYILGRVVEEAADAALVAGTTGGLEKGEYIGKFYANFFRYVNIGGVLIQLFVVSRILKYFGIRIAILALPLIAMFGYIVIAFIPILSIVRWAKTAENSTDYSLQNTVRHILFLPTSREQKYKAKQAIDSFFHRAGDVLSAGVVYVGFELLSFGTTGFALFNLALVAVWLVLAVMIGRENKRLVEQQAAAGNTEMRDQK
ncbi:MAG: translocase, partial [bacterium]